MSPGKGEAITPDWDVWFQAGPPIQMILTYQALEPFSNLTFFPVIKWGWNK